VPTRILEDVKVVEASQWVMGPGAAAILADWGASVVRIEHPQRGDPLRGTLPSMGWDTSEFDFYVEQNNHSKRSIGLDLGASGGREVLLDLIADADVFLTSFLEPARRRWGVTYDDLRARNPGIVYARTSGYGPHGPQAYAPGFDAISYWARGSVGYMATPEGGRARPMPAGGFGDVQGAVALAGGIAAALYRRTRSGEGALVDVSLLGLAAWDMYETLQATSVYQIDAKRDFKPGVITINPLTGVYPTRDGRDIALNMNQPDPFWPGFCAALAMEELEHDPRFESFNARADNHVELRQIITERFASRDLDDLVTCLAEHRCAFAPFKSPDEVLVDEQVQANGYLRAHPAGERFFVVASPVEFDEQYPPVVTAAPEVGQHTEEILLELGYEWDRIIELKDAGVIT
jgi:crotonobetainyl-CoA:carnitine CoA-transferase CaiB-like acyl-CoA transferase